MKKNLIKRFVHSFILILMFAFLGLNLFGCGEINASFIIKIYNQTNNSNSFGYEQTCVIDFYGNNITTKSSYLKINQNLLELKVLETSLNDFEEDEAMTTLETHIFYDGTFKYEKQGSNFVKLNGSPEFNNDNKANFKTSYLEEIKITNLKEENKTLLNAKIKDVNVKDVLNEENLTNANVSILYNNSTKKIENVILTYYSLNNNLVTILTNYYQEAQSVIIPSV